MGALTSFECICSVTYFAIRQYKSPFTDFKVEWLNGCIGFDIDGKYSRKHELYDDTMSKESLAAKPVRIMTEDWQWWLRFGYNLAEDHLDVHFQGVDINTLMPEDDNEIYMNKYVKNENGEVLQQLFYAIQNNLMHVITA